MTVRPLSTASGMASRALLKYIPLYPATDRAAS